jgi:hypothetical protein
MKNCMAIQVFLPSELLWTIRAFKWFLLFMNITSVHLKSCFPVEDFVTVVTLESIFPRVIEHMSLESSDLDELLLTVRTLMGSDSSVNSHVTIESSLQRKLDIASISGTSIRFFACMNS